MNESTPSKHNGGTLSVVMKADSGNDNRHKYCNILIAKSDFSKSQS